jgi:hypothetical protein
MKTLKTLLVIQLLAALLNETKAQWTQVNFEDKYLIESILSYKGGLYVSANAVQIIDTSGVFKSTDYGNSWARVSNAISASHFSKLMAFSVNAADYIFVATDSGSYYTSDYGLSWIRIINSLSQDPVAVFAQEDGILYASKYLHTYRSIDFGATWQEIFFGSANRGAGAIIKKDNFLLATLVDGSSDFLFRSTDNGLTWNSYGGYIYQANTMTVVGNNIYAGSWTTLNKSTDNGLNWSLVNGLPSGYNFLNIKAYGDYLFCVHLTGIYFQHKDSTNWHNASFELTPFFMAGEIDQSFIYTETNQRTFWKRPVTDVITEISEQCEPPAPGLMLRNSPNPFNHATEIKWQTSASGFTLLKVFDSKGKEIGVLLNENLAAGEHRVSFCAEGLPDGVYFYQLWSNGKVETKKMVLIK